MPTHDVIVEVDEKQHRGYDESCEWQMAARISEIVGAMGGKSVVFVQRWYDIEAASDACGAANSDVARREMDITRLVAI